jgi:tetratricopeptide (TPR) repeat protein
MMTHLRPRAILLLFWSTLLPAAAAAPRGEVPIEQRVVALVFANSMATWTGSGFAIGDGRWIVTNHHVATRRFAPDKYLTLRRATVLSPWTGQAHQARVVAVDQPADLALLRLEDATLPSLPLAPADFLDRPPALPRPPVQLYGYPSVADRAGWDSSQAAHMARSQGLVMTSRNEVPVLMLAPAAGPAKGWGGGPAIWTATRMVVGSFNALVSLPEEPDRWMPQVIGISRLRAFLTGAGVEATALDRGVTPPQARPSDAATAFRHLIRIASAGFVDEWETAEREARALVQMRPASPEAQRALGSTLASAGKNEEALKALEESRRLAPAAVPTLSQRAAVLKAMGRRADAEAELRAILAIDPDDYEAMFQRAEILADTDRLTEARDLLKRAVQLAPHHPLIHWELGMVLRRLGETQQGLAECKAAVELTVETEPLRPMRLAYARMLSLAGRAEEAEKELREAVRLDDNDPGTHLALASFLAEAGRRTEARDEARKALTLQPDDELRQAAAALLKQLEPATP